MKNYKELTVKTTHEASELVADILSEYTDEGVSIADIEDVLDLEKKGKSWDYADEKVYTADKTVIVKAYFSIEKADEIINEIKDRLNELKSNCPFSVGTLNISTALVDGDEWREKWKENFKPIHIGKIVIVPEWIKYQKKDDEKTVLLDSNMAFGTGEHETTSMCVEFLGKYVKPENVVLDVGSGSGILGITASKLGARQVIMTDIDECAVKASEHNAQLNKITNYTVLLKNLLDDNTVKGDIIVCNIMAEVLIAFAPFIGGNLLPAGKIILSGILADRLEKVKSAYKQAGFIFVEEKIKGEWSAVVFKGSNSL